MLVEIIGNQVPSLENRVKEKAILYNISNGVIMAIVDRKDIEGLPGIVLMKEVPTDIEQLKYILKKYGVKKIALTIYVDTFKDRGKLIGKNGWKIKKIRDHLKMPVEVVSLDGHSGVPNRCRKKA